ncbi:MAG TPA: hypothetical protein VN228_21980 [Pyrinomonadaceae bacterium]|nr:hypothetical protein [Pyrinomonadaceae bacterium]
MRELLLKRALPFALTFAVGAAAGGFFQLFGAREGGHWGRWNYHRNYEGRRGCGKKFRRHYFAPEAKPPVILFKPDAQVPRSAAGGAALPERVRVRVRFGEDGKVQEVNPYVEGEFVSAGFYEAATRAARHIQFIPALADGVPTATTEVVEIRVTRE